LPNNGPVITAFRKFSQAGDVYFEWGESKKLAQWIQQNQANELTVIGHSYGGDTAATVVARGNYVDTLVTVDPVGRFKPNFGKVASNSGVWVNIDSVSTIKNGPNIISYLGGRFDSRPQGFADVFLESQLDHVDVCSRYCAPVR